MSQTDRGERAFDRIGCPNVTPVLRRKIEEREQHVAVFRQTRNAFFVLYGEGLIERFAGILFCRCFPGVVQDSLRLWLNALRQFVQHACRLVNRTTLNSCAWEDLLQSLSEAQCSFAGRQFRSMHQASCFETQQHFLLGKFTLAMTIDNGDEFLRSVSRGSHQNQ